MDWIKISDRMPSEEENNNPNLMWWHNERECYIDGQNKGTYIYCGEVEYHLEEFTHWAIVEGPKDE